LALLLTGVAWLPALRRTPVVSYTTFSPLPVTENQLIGGISLWPYPAGKRFVKMTQRPPPRVLPGIMLCGVRTFLDSGNRSRDRLTNLGVLMILFSGEAGKWRRGVYIGN